MEFTACYEANMKQRSRIIKPGFFLNEDLAELDPLTRILFAGLWTIADREGRLKDRPRRIKALCLPYDQVDVDLCLNELEKVGFLIRYCVKGELYIQITNFKKHQSIHHKESASEIPEPQEEGHSQIEHGSSMRQACDVLGSSTKEEVEVEEDIEKEVEEKEKAEDKIPYFEIIDDLNDKAGTKYKHTSEKTKALVKALWKQGFRIEDFKLVHSKKIGSWIGTDMAKFIRPITLYSNKFESYLNELPEDTRFSKTTRRNLIVANQWLQDRKNKLEEIDNDGK